MRTKSSYNNKFRPSLSLPTFLKCCSNLPKTPFSKIHLLYPSTNLFQPAEIPPSNHFHKSPPVPIKPVNKILKTKLVLKIQNKFMNNFLLVLLRSMRKIRSSVLGLFRTERRSVISWVNKKISNWKKLINLKLELKIEIRIII